MKLTMELPKILIIDDREFDRIIYREYLGEANYAFEEMEDGIGILERLPEVNPNLILLDWQMPRQGGLETLKMISKNAAYKDTPIIIITGLQDESVLEEAFDYGSFDFLNKPVTRVELQARVFKAIKLKEAQIMLQKQKKELLDLNRIISSQKEELNKTLEIKTQLLDTSEVEHKKDISEVKRKMITMEMDTTKISNHIKEIRTLIEETYTQLKSENPESSVLRRLRQLERKVAELTQQDHSWGEFKDVFESMDTEFFNKLTKRNPKLTSLDLKHCAYIKMNIDNYELARILNVEMKSLQMTRYRLKKKLDLGQDQSLREYIHSV